MAKTGFADDFKRNFLTGIAALFPILITLFLFTWVYRQADRTIGRQANAVCREVLVWNPALFRAFFRAAPEQVTLTVEGRRAYTKQYFPRAVGSVVGLAGAIIAVYIIGRLLRGYIGRRVMRAVDRLFERFPVIKSVYPHARQVGDFIFGQSERRRFSGVVAVEYPRRGVYSVGFMTGDALPGMGEQAGRDLVTVFIPTSPTPVTGFIIAVPPEETTRLDMTVDEAFRYFITAGMLTSTKPNAVGVQAASQTRLAEVQEASERPEGSPGAPPGEEVASRDAGTD
ncbi:MAG: DUF502 domain-containing protein [Planctomycetota bacterium]|jgi:uncharacterized membrane protein